MSFCMRVLMMSLMLLAFPAVAKDIDNKKSSGLSWPIPWDEMLALRYDVTQSKRDERKDKPASGYSSSYVVTISGRSTGKGYEQSWQSDHNQMALLTPDPIMESMVESLAESTKNKPMLIVLDGDGYFQSLREAESWAVIIRTAMHSALDSYFKSTQVFKALSVEEQDKAYEDYQKKMAPVMSAIGSESFVTSMLTKLPAVYNDFAGGGLPLGQDIAFEHESENPLGGKPFPMHVTARLDRAKEDPYVTVTVRSRLNSEKAAPILLDTVKKLLPDLTEDDLKSNEVQDIFKNMDIGGDVEYRINTVTGVVHYLNIVERKRFPNRSEIETTQMVLK